LLIVTYLSIFIKYTAFYLYFYLFGKFIISKIFKFTKEERSKELVFTKTEYLAPFFGLLILGNLLIILNIFTPLNNIYVNIFLILLPFLSLKKFRIDIKKYLNTNFIFNYLVIPGILVISTVDITFNYDAGYYHLLHQNWIRESEVIVGMVNIFFALGMSSIYEYLSAILWFDSSFVYLHFLNIYFLHFFYLFIKQHFLNKKYTDLYNVAFVILIYSILDNFGFGGGRNGYAYIQGVTKQDTTVGILFWFLSIVILKKIKEKNISNSEIVTISLISFFVYQIKVSGVLVFILYFILVIYILKLKLVNFTKLIYLHTPVILIAVIWFGKSLFTTGCFIYPVDFTCIEIFDWYVIGSTAEVEYYTKLASKNYTLQTPFTEWIRVVAKDTFEYRGQVLKNFTASFLIIFVLKYFLFLKQKIKFNIFLISILFLIFNFTYLLFYGPIPRYTIGVCLVSVSLIGFFAGKSRYEINDYFKYFLIFISIFLIVRLHSYESLVFNDEIRLFDPRTSPEVYEKVGFSDSFGNWVRPNDGDQCWANLECTMSDEDVIFIEKGLFKYAYRK
jgi:hypothetical protein